VRGTINGVGRGFVGKRDVAVDGSYITTEWFIIVVPVFPLRSYRARLKDRLYLGAYNRENYEVAPVPLCRPQVLNTYAAVYGPPILAALTIPFLQERLGLFLVLLGAVPVIIAAVFAAQSSKNDALPTVLAKFLGLVASMIPVVGLVAYFKGRGRPSGYGERCGAMALLGVAIYVVYSSFN
jgi:hypothetical protein